MKIIKDIKLDKYNNYKRYIQYDEFIYTIIKKKKGRGLEGYALKNIGKIWAFWLTSTAINVIMDIVNY